MLRTLIAAILIYSSALAATAQAINTEHLPSPSDHARTVTEWPVAQGSIPHSIDVVTLAHPSVRHRCIITDLTAEAITCKASHRRPPATYQREDIAALINPPSHSERNAMLIPITLLAVSLVASFFVPLAGSITLRIFAGLCLSAFGAMGVGASGTDHNGDRILYQRLNTPLSITLR